MLSIFDSQLQLMWSQPWASQSQRVSLLACNLLWRSFNWDSPIATFTLTYKIPIP